MRQKRVVKSWKHQQISDSKLELSPFDHEAQA